jgi:hypothetical protein
MQAMATLETTTSLRSVVERRLMPSQSILFMAWLELMLKTEGQTFVREVQKRHVNLVAGALFVPD